MFAWCQIRQIHAARTVANILVNDGFLVIYIDMDVITFCVQMHIKIHFVPHRALQHSAIRRGGDRDRPISRSFGG